VAKGEAFFFNLQRLLEITVLLYHITKPALNLLLQVALIQTRDAFGNPVSDNGSSVAALQAAFALALVPNTLPGRQIPVPSDVRFDASSDNYTASFSVQTAGVLLTSNNGKGLARQLVLPGPVDAEKTRVWGAGLARVIVGGTGRFSLLVSQSFPCKTAAFFVVFRSKSRIRTLKAGSYEKRVWRGF
jgi:hypothetical protein